jgi:hypothetical protein
MAASAVHDVGATLDVGAGSRTTDVARSEKRNKALSFRRGRQFHGGESRLLQT